MLSHVTRCSRDSRRTRLLSAPARERITGWLAEFERASKRQVVVVTVKDNLMVLTFQDADLGEAFDEIEVQYSGEEIVKSYNINYFLAAVEVIDDQYVNFEIGTDSKPSVVRGSGNDRYMCIIMPLKQ